MGVEGQDRPQEQAPACAPTRELIVRAIQGDRAALGEILAHFEPVIRATVLRHLGPGRMSVDGDDALQIVRMGVLEAIPGVRESRPSALGAWIRKVAASRLIDWEKARRSSRRSSDRPILSLVATDAPEVAGKALTGSRILMRAEEKRRLERAIEQVPDRYRPVLRFILSHEPTPAELSSFLLKETEAARKFVGRALEHLKRALGDSSRGRERKEPP